MTDQTTTDDRWHLTKTTSPRGFAFLPPIPSEYGGHISVSESSAADGPHVWVRAVSPIDLNDPDGPTHEAAMHLTADNAQRLAEQLEATVAGHYQGIDGPARGSALLRRALELIGTDCANYTAGTCVDAPERTPDARYTSVRWCDQCIARTALNGEQIPEASR